MANQYNNDGNKECFWEVYHENGILLYKCNYIDGIKNGG